MKPKDWKTKTATHIPSDTVFVVIGGAKKGGKWYLKDEQNTLYLFDECQLIVHSDVYTLKTFTYLDQLTEFHDEIGSKRFSEALSKLEETPLEAAAIALLYCDCWSDFETVTEIYKVSSKINPQRNAEFKALLAQKGLAARVRGWYEQRNQKEAA